MCSLCSQGIVRRLCESDAQLFAGWGGHPGINDHVILDKIWKSSQKAFALLKVLFLVFVFTFAHSLLFLQKNKEQQRNNVSVKIFYLCDVYLCCRGLCSVGAVQVEEW